jgi:hypothetical protein
MEDIKKEISELRSEIKTKTAVWGKRLAELYELARKAEQKEEPEEKLSGLDFHDASRIVDGTEGKLKYKNGEWASYAADDEHSCGVLFFENGRAWWPNSKQRMEKVWSAEPEKKDIFIYCACDSDGKSYAFNNYPQKIVVGGSFQWDSGDGPIEFEERNLFPKKEPVKCVIIPAPEV